uniref:Solute carrier family 39 member 5 n=1 Tax=Calidris pygmaea TaxID=425635 RepID=A0A8C3K1B8_9CHAR
MAPHGLLLGVLGLLALGAGGPSAPPLPEDAAQETGYYLQQLFGQYGANGTLPSEGLARLLGSLGLGRVQVVRIQHEELGHAGPDPAGEGAGLGALQRRPPPPRRERGLGGWGDMLGPPLGIPNCSLSPSGTWGPPAPLPPTAHCPPCPCPPPTPQCLNVTQLLVNFGLDAASQLTPEQFTLLCPALLYQIDSRVCIQSPGPSPSPPDPSLGWGLLAVTLLSLPSALAVLLVPLLSRGFFRSLLAFLVALAVGTLCGDALLHLWPHAQGRHQETPGEPGAAVLQGLAVLGGIYLLFLLELLLGVLRRR